MPETLDFVRDCCPQWNVNPSRDGSGVLRIRVAWRGGLVTERSIKVPVSTIRGTERERCLVERIRTLACAGETDTAIAEQLEREGLTLFW